MLPGCFQIGFGVEFDENLSEVEVVGGKRNGLLICRVCLLMLQDSCIFEKLLYIYILYLRMLVMVCNVYYF